jgi:hypothetical protein
LTVQLPNGQEARAVLETPELYRFESSSNYLRHTLLEVKMATQYVYNGPIDCAIEVDRSQMKGKTVVITGGTNLS